MAITPTYPGVYIQELQPAGPQGVVSVSTSTTAFVDYFQKGPLTATAVQSYAEFERTFGGLDERSPASYQVYQYFLNGGQKAYIVRVVPGDSVVASVDVVGRNLVIPGSVTLGPSMQQVFTATSSDPKGVTWRLQRYRGTPAPPCGTPEEPQQPPAPSASDFVEDLGTITPDRKTNGRTATYTAPYAVGGPDANGNPVQVLVVAESCTNCGEVMCAVVTLIPVEVDITSSDDPERLVAPGETLQFRATVQGSSSQTVSWELLLPGSPPESGAPASSVYGALDPQTGLYTAPSKFPVGSPPSETVSLVVKATTNYSIVLPDGSVKSRQAVATDLFSLVPVHVVPDNPTIAKNPAGQGVLLTAKWGSAQYQGNQVAYRWTVSGGAPVLQHSSRFCFVPDDNGGGSGNVQVSCEVLVNPNPLAEPLSPPADVPDIFASPPSSDSDLGSWAKIGEGTSTVVVLDDVSVTISPAGPPVSSQAGQTPDQALPLELAHGLQLEATVLGSPNQSVTWSLSGAGNVDQGYYKAPDNITQQSVTVEVLASSDADPSADPGKFYIKITRPDERLTVRAANPGDWGNNLAVQLTAPRTPPQAGNPNPPFNLIASLYDDEGNVLATEKYTGLTLDPSDSRYAPAFVNTVSALVQVVDNGPQLDYPYAFPATPPPPFQPLSGGFDGIWDQATAEFAEALQNAVGDDTSPLLYIAPDIFNILCMPATAQLSSGAMEEVLVQAQKLCHDNHAFMIIDIPPSDQIPNPAQMVKWYLNNPSFLATPYADAAAVYYPRVTIPDPANKYRAKEIGVSGTLAGIFAANDIDRGVWSAPAGTNARMAGVSPVYKMTDEENGSLNPLGVNALRSFPIFGDIVWGARTLDGADELESQWKYINVRRLADYIEDTAYASLRWAVFELNEPPLWNAIVNQLQPFMNALYQAGAFGGTSASSAYLVKCDATTTTPSDQQAGIVNVILGFQPAYPAEFVIVTLQQLTQPSS